MSDFNNEIEEHISKTQKRIKVVTDKIEELGSLAEGLARARDRLGKSESALGAAVEEIKSAAGSLQDLAKSVRLLREGYEQQARTTQAILKDSDFANVRASVDTLCSDVAKLQTEISREIAQSLEQVSNRHDALAQSVESTTSELQGMRAISEENNKMCTALDQALQMLHLQQKKNLKIVMITSIVSAATVLGVIVYLH